jgi:hypothetical protein
MADEASSPEGGDRADGRHDGPMERDQWIERFARELGVDPPLPETVELLLAVAGEAAHASERTAAPIACYLVGRAGIPPSHALATAEAVRPDP